MNPDFILFSQNIRNQSIQASTQNLTAPPRNLAIWPPVPFDIPISNHPDGRIHFFKTYRQGTDTQNAEAQLLIAGEVEYLDSHGGTIGPKDISIDPDWTTIWLGCHAWVEPRTRWTNRFAIDTLKSLRDYLKVNGFQESEFDVTDGTSWLATCQFRLHAPFQAPAAAIRIS